MKKRLILVLVAVMVLFAGLEALRHTYQSAASKLEPGLAQEVRAIEARYAETPAEPGLVLFVGSSSIRRWETLATDMQPLEVLNHGFGGSELGDIKQHQEALVDRYKARVIVIYSGDNDLSKSSGKTLTQVTSNYRLLLESLRKKNKRAKIYCLSIKASPARLGRWSLMKTANQAIRTWCGPRDAFTFVDVATPLLDERGLPKPEFYLEDGIHLNSEGYQIWTQVIREQLLADLED